MMLICRYGRRFAFFVMLFMAVSLSTAIAFSPNYIVYTVLRWDGGGAVTSVKYITITVQDNKRPNLPGPVPDPLHTL